MKKKTVIVTGASGNMGQAVVKKFLAEGYHVVGTVIPNDPVALEIENPNWEKLVVDLMNADDAEKLVQVVIGKYQAIDVLVCTVGGFAMGNIANTAFADINKQISLNFETAYNTVRPAFKQMKQQGSGRIFLVGSKPGLSAGLSKGMLAYGLAKSLIFRLAEMLNDEAKGKNVVTSVLVPSTIDTPQNRNSMPGADFESWVSPEAIAEVVSFYCTDAASVLRKPIIKLYNNA